MQYLLQNQNLNLQKKNSNLKGLGEVAGADLLHTAADSAYPDSLTMEMSPKPLAAANLNR